MRTISGVQKDVQLKIVDTDDGADDVIEKEWRDAVKEAVSKLTYNQLRFFKRMYTHSHLMATSEEIIDNLPFRKLPHILTQVTGTGLFTQPTAADRDEVNHEHSRLTVQVTD